MRYGWVLGLLVLTYSGAANAQGEVPSKDEFCREMLDLAGDLIAQSALILMAPTMEHIEETGEFPSDAPEGDPTEPFIGDTAQKVAEQVIAYCRL